MHLDASQLAFVAGLGKSPTGQQLRGLIKACTEDSNAKLRVLSGDALAREQGRAQMLDQLTDWLEPRLMPARDLSVRRPVNFDVLA
jgi:hypothetical protein